jgi:HD-GYP domain-containing protein (c-di-GMP phosphodiesterase class II)/CheY-like chemotaxis protein
VGTPLRILLVEDSADDAQLLLRELRRGGYDPVYERVETAEGMAAALKDRTWDLVVSDFSMPRFNAPAALEVLKRTGLDIPFVTVSGSIAEEDAVDVLKTGATDHFTKGHLARLVPAIERELREAGVRRARGQAEATVGRQDAILKAVGSAAQKLLRSRRWHESIHEVLAVLGRAAEASRAYIYECHTHPDGRPLISPRHEWVADGIAPQLDNPALQGFDWHARGYGRWAEIFQRGEPMHGRTAALSPDEQEIFVARGVRSFAIVPILVEEKWWGLIGLNDCVQERDWTTGEIGALRTAADTVAAAIRRNQVEEQIEEQLRRLAGLRAVSTAITGSLDLRVTLNILLDQVTSQLHVDAATVLLLKQHGQTLDFAAGRGFRTSALQYTSLRLGEGLAGEAALQGRIVSVPDLREEKGSLARAELLADEGFVAYYAAPLIAKGQVQGVLELFHRSPLNIDSEWMGFLEALASQAAVAIDNASLFNDLQRSNVELMLAYETTLDGWSRALDLRDRETEGHTLRVTEMTLRIAQAMGMSEGELVHMRRGGLLHDIGKMGIPDKILLKPGPLDDEEWRIMKLHPVYAFQLLSPITYLRPALDIPYCHHEWWNGSGYPRGLTGEVIPLQARVFAIADVWDALRSDRPYRPAWPEERVLEHIRGLTDTHFDPMIVDVFMSMLNKGIDARRHAPRTPALPGAEQVDPDSLSTASVPLSPS